MLNVPLDNFDQLALAVRAEILQREPIIIGHRDDGTNMHLRYRASLGSTHVKVHVQGAGVGEGGGTYNPDDFITSVTVDCRESRAQDVEMTSGHYWIWLIPMHVDAIGSILYNGLNGAPDNMAFIELGA